MNNKQQAALNGIGLSAHEGALPEWVELIPAGQVVGRDGRAWINSDPQAIIAAFAGGRADLPVDVEHATELKAPLGDPAPAAGWVQELNERNGAIWGRVEWNETGAGLVGGRQYRYLSPVIIYEKGSGLIVGLTSVALTNRPNLTLQALNHQGDDPEENNMDKALLAALGLPETATTEQALAAIATLKGDLAGAINRADNPSLAKFVPKADYDLAINRATTAEAKIAQGDKDRLEAEIETAINQALQDGKIAPASKEFYLATCRAEGGLEQFKKFVASAPKIVADSTLDGKQVPGETATALNADQTKIMQMFGNSAEDLAKYGK